MCFSSFVHTSEHERNQKRIVAIIIPMGAADRVMSKDMSCLFWDFFMYFLNCS